MLPKPRALSLEAFSWDDNSFSRLFQQCGGSAGFIQAWNQTSNSGPADQTHRDSRKRQPTSLPALTPVSKTARISTKEGNDQVDSIENRDHDQEIAKYFIGI